jgi:hypothetical protein
MGFIFSSYYTLIYLFFMTIKFIKKEKVINKIIYREFLNSCFKVVICHVFQAAVIIGQCPCTIPEGFCAGVSANNFPFELIARLPVKVGWSLGVRLGYLSSLCWWGNRARLLSLLT